MNGPLTKDTLDPSDETKTPPRPCAGTRPRDELRADTAKSDVTQLDLIEYFELAGLPLCITDRRGIIRYANDTYCSVTGLDPNKCIGKPEPFENAVAKMVGETGQAAIRVKHFSNPILPGGRYITAVPVFGNGTQVKAVVVTVESDEMISRRYRAMSMAKMRAEQSVRICHDPGENTKLPELLGQSRSMETVRQLIKRVGPTLATVLITGESGSGKEVIADSIQRVSNRRNKPYVKINCSALPANLLESEIFGYEKGAFTGASPKGKPGLFEMAEGGTILLDEIGDFPLELQPKLLRVLQNKEFYRLGGSTPIKLDARILAATNSDLLDKVRSGAFREDLYYRLCIFPIHSPPLRERPEDIEGLINHFFDKYCEEYNRNIRMSPTVMNMLKTYNWPGNVRELQNVVEYYIICSDENSEMSTEALKNILRMDDIGSAFGSGKSLSELRDEYERSVIIDALSRSKSAREAAKRLKISPATLYRKISQYKIPVSPDE